MRNPLIAGTLSLLIPGLVLTSARSEEHTSEFQSHSDLVCRLLLEKKKSVSGFSMSVPAKLTGYGVSFGRAGLEPSYIAAHQPGVIGPCDSTQLDSPSPSASRSPSF